jgi:hypothetical protein
VTEDTTTRDRQVVAAVRGGDSLRTVGRRFGISHERVRQIVERDDPGAIPAGLAARAAAAPTPDPEPTFTKVCPVCSRTFTTTDERRVTDRSDCAELWQAGYRFSSPERMAQHQDNVARTYLRQPDKYGATKVRWAVRHLQARGHELPAEYRAAS